MRVSSSVSATDSTSAPGGDDTNGDGKLSRAEFPEPMRRAFDRVDANRDGAEEAPALDVNEAEESIVQQNIVAEDK